MSPSEEIYTRVISKSHPQQMMPGCDIPQPKRKANHQPLEKKGPERLSTRSPSGPSAGRRCVARRGLRGGNGRCSSSCCHAARMRAKRRGGQPHVAPCLGEGRSRRQTAKGKYHHWPRAGCRLTVGAHGSCGHGAAVCCGCVAPRRGRRQSRQQQAPQSGGSLHGHVEQIREILDTRSALREILTGYCLS